MKIFIGLNEIAGYYANLKKGFDDLGIKCNYVCLGEHSYKYNNNSSYWVKKISKIMVKKNTTNKNKFIKWFFYVGLYAFLKFFLFIWALFNHNVFIFGYNSTFYKYYDLPILKLFNKKIIYMFHGSDSRPPYMSGRFFSLEMSVNECIDLTKLKKKIINKIERFADIIINIPPQAYFFKKPFVHGNIIGIPFSITNDKLINKNNYIKTNHDDDNIVILHAPSDPVIKGTESIRKIINTLKNKGHNINYIELSGVPNSKVIEEIISCDFVISQLYSDTPMAGFATEASYFAKPSISGGYYSKIINEDLPEKYIPPSIYCHPDKVEFEAEQLIIDKNKRIELGEKAKNFVHNSWSPKKVAERYLMLIEGNFPKEWYYNPQNIKYLHGSGNPEYKVKELLKEVINTGGVKALQISDKPYLEKQLLKFSGIDNGDIC